MVSKACAIHHSPLTTRFNYSLFASLRHSLGAARGSGHGTGGDMRRGSAGEASGSFWFGEHAAPGDERDKQEQRGGINNGELSCPRGLDAQVFPRGIAVVIPVGHRVLHYQPALRYIEQARAV